ncbi:MAG: hypothetical protein PVG07_14665 [Acidobacteriota bacterium]|jgi:hypothetical protein
MSEPNDATTSSTTSTTSGGPSPGTPPGEIRGTGSGRPDLWQALLTDCQVMVEHAYRNGTKLPARVIETVQKAIALERDRRPGEIDLGKLQLAYNRLIDRLAPATPASISASDPEADSMVRFRRRWVVYLMMALGVLSLVGYLWTLSRLDSAAGLGPNLVLHLVCGAGLGAAFNALFTAYRYLVQRTFDPKYNMTYVIRFFLGLIAGVVLAGIIDPSALSQEGGVLAKLGPGVIALLGGYAAEAVQLILGRIVEMLVALVRGGAKDRVEAETERLRAEQERAAVGQRLGIVQELAKAAREIGPDVGSEELRKKLEELQVSVLDEGAE